MSRILLTGASRGIGRATAVALAARGHEVIATARDVETLADVPAALRLSLDVTDQASVDAAIDAAGPVDVLVSNAGATVRAPVETVPLAAPTAPASGPWKHWPRPWPSRRAGSASRCMSCSPAQAILAARKAAPEDAPFLAAPLDW